MSAHMEYTVKKNKKYLNIIETINQNICIIVQQIECILFNISCVGQQKILQY